MVVQGVRKPTGMVELQLGGIEQLCALFERQYLGPRAERVERPERLMLGMSSYTTGMVTARFSTAPS